MNSITYIGLDVHKTTIAVAVAEGGRLGDVRQLGTFPNRADVMRKMVERLARPGGQLSFCYEAGPCGYGLHRFLRGRGHACAVVAPSLIPIKAGDRIKTNRRDAVTLARLHRAGELTEVWVPPTKRCATSYEHAQQQQRFSPRRASTSVDSCCDTGRSILVFEPGRKPIDAG